MPRRCHNIAMAAPLPPTPRQRAPLRFLFTPCPRHVPTPLPRRVLPADAVFRIHLPAVRQHRYAEDAPFAAVDILPPAEARAIMLRCYAPC